MTQVEIYGLIDPRGPWLRYIGKAKDSAKRLTGHLREAGKGRRRYPLYAWLRGLQADGIIPDLVILAICTEETWRDAEKDAIRIALEEKHPLLNVAAGGDEPYCSTETRAENGRRNAKARVQDDRARQVYEFKRNMGLYLKKGWVAERTKVLLRRAAAERPDLFSCWANL